MSSSSMIILQEKVLQNTRQYRDSPKQSHKATELVLTMAPLQAMGRAGQIQALLLLIELSGLTLQLKPYLHLHQIQSTQTLSTFLDCHGLQEELSTFIITTVCG